MYLVWFLLTSLTLSYSTHFLHLLISFCPKFWWFCPCHSLCLECSSPWSVPASSSKEFTPSNVAHPLLSHHSTSKSFFFVVACVSHWLPLEFDSMKAENLPFFFTLVFAAPGLGFSAKSTPVLLPGKSHGWRSLVGCSPWSRKELGTTERLHFHFALSCIGEGNGNPLQCSCLENPRDGGAWWAAVYGVSQSRTQLKRLSSSSSIVSTWC